MKRPKPMCIVCREREAAVPDRNAGGRPTRKVCLECHADRLRGDIVQVLRAAESRRAAIASEVFDPRFMEVEQ